MKNKDQRAGSYGYFWDYYVRDKFPKIQSAAPYTRQQLEPWRIVNNEDEHYEWPGDEWGSRTAALRLFDETLTSQVDPEACCLCELGAGAGRYTILALEKFQKATVLSFDVSAQFEQALQERCRTFLDSGQLRTYLLNEDPGYLLQSVKQENLLGKIAAVYSFDAMVHVDLHTLLIYWASAAKMLKPGGIIAMNIANACSEKGAMKLLNNAPSAYAERGSAAGHFNWISKEVVESILQRLGFEVSYPDGNGRDLSFCARLTDPKRADTWIKEVTSTTLMDFLGLGEE